MLRPGVSIALLVLLVASIPAIPASASAYVVRPGDTLGSIAAVHGVSIGALARANGIANVNLIRAGRTLVIPDGRVAQAAVSVGGGRSYHVAWGDTLSGIAARYGTTVAELRALNPSFGGYLLAGQWLRVCSGCGAVRSAGSVASAPATPATGGYVVQPGDSLSLIASRLGVSVSALMAANGLANPDFIVAGRRLAVPGGGSPVPGGGSPAPVASGGLPVRSLITSYSSQYGVEPAFAQAIGWEESGFNPSAVSSTGAVGVMQIEPYTGTHIAGALGRPLNLYDRRDNVQAGTFWLSRLLQYYGGNEYLAAAAYYQGIGSIQRHGLYRDTRRYAANVLSLRSSFGG